MHALEQAHIEREDERATKQQSDEHTRQTTAEKHDFTSKMASVIGGYVFGAVVILACFYYTDAETRNKIALIFAGGIGGSVGGFQLGKHAEKVQADKKNNSI